MGNCYPTKSKKLKETTEPSCSKPFFRQKSLKYTRSDETYLYGGIWEKRQSVEDVFGSMCAAIKETVFDKDSRGEGPTITGCEEDHYDQINESEIRSINEKEKVKDHQLLDVKRFNMIKSMNLKLMKRKRVLPPPPPPYGRRPPLLQAPNSSDTDQFTNNSIQTNSNVISCESDIDICKMVEIFQPLIVNNLLVHEVLPHLSFLENHSDLYEEVKTCSQKVAVVSLLEELQRSTRPGKWLKFVNVLNECGYTYIVKNIRGYTFVNHNYQKHYLKTITPQLSKMIDPADLIPYLLAENLISDYDKENIQRQKVNFGDIEAAVLLLDRITRKHEDWYILFVKVLQKAGRDDIAADLMIPQLLQNPRRKDRDTSWLPKMTRSSSTYSHKEIEDQSDDDDEYALPPAPPCPATAEDSSQNSSAELQIQRSEDEYESPQSVAAFCRYSALSENLYDLNPEPVTDEVQSKPPIPPRKPYKKECPLPLQIMHNSNNDQPKQQIIQKLNAVPQRMNCFQYPNDDDGYETYDDNVTNPNETMVNDADDINLLHDIQKLELENKNVSLKNNLLVRKNTLNENINKGLKKQRELQNEIAVKEKEKQALLSGYDTNVPEDNTDEYYPTNTKANDKGKIHEPSVITRNWTKRTFDYRPLLHFEHPISPELTLMTQNYPPSIVQLYSPNFVMRSVISQRFELDSGIGAEIDNTDFESH